MKFDLVIKNGVMVSPAETVSGNDIAAKEGRVAAIDRCGSFSEAKEYIDAAGKYVLPGIIDAHVHFREPGYEYKEDFKTGSAAAACGGVTTVFDMPNNLPVCSTPETLKEKLEIIKSKSYVDYGLFAAVTQESVELVPKLAEAGANAFKVFMGATVGGVPAPDDDGILRAFELVRESGLRVGVHAENNAIINFLTSRLKAAGRTDPLTHTLVRPAAAEAEAVQRAILFAQTTGCNLHICHLSTKEGVAIVRESRQTGDAVSAETAPHYLLLDEDYMKQVGGVMKINPPIRSRSHGKALWQGLLDGTIDMNATDHAPHSLEEKMDTDIWKVNSGFIGVETQVPLMLTQVNAGRLSLNTYVKLASENPARLFNLYPRKGVIAVGSDADFTIIDMDKEATIVSHKLHSQNPITPFDGWKVKGVPVCTLVRGQIVMRDGEIIGQPEGNHVQPIV